MIKKGELYWPDAAAKKKAWLKSKNVYAEAEKNPVKFWEKIAKELVWKKKWSKVYADTPPHIKWFAGAKLNITENCLDRHLSLRKNKVALIWEGDDDKEPSRTLTYYDLYRQVNKLANALKNIGVKKGRPGVDIFTDDSGGGGIDAGLCAHRRGAFGGVLGILGASPAGAYPGRGR
jgi:acetyl-CoA synthetase